MEAQWKNEDKAIHSSNEIDTVEKNNVNKKSAHGDHTSTKPERNSRAFMENAILYLPTTHTLYLHQSAVTQRYPEIEFYNKLDMSQLWWLQRIMAAESWVTISKRISAVSGSKVTYSRSIFRGNIVDWHYHFCLSMRRFVPEICGVERGSRRKGGPKFDVFLAPNLAESSQIFGRHL